LNIPYYITPDGEVGRQAYIVIRDAMKREGVVGLGLVIFTTREHVIAIEPRDKGLLGVTLRYPYEIRKEQDYFGDLADEKVPKQMLELATHHCDQSRAIPAGEIRGSLQARARRTDQEEAARRKNRETKGANLDQGD
jgi:Ku protein